MRGPLVLLLLVLLAGGCRSGRDYKSINRSSREFLRDTHRTGKEMRKKNLHQALQLRDRRSFNRKQRKDGLAFAWGALWENEAEKARVAWVGLRDEMRFSNKGIGRNARFGFLDSGE